jgi:hypothetical protein
VTEWANGYAHVFPLGDLKPHDLDSTECWCKPTVCEDGLVIHNSMDRREEHEKGVRRLS